MGMKPRKETAKRRYPKAAPLMVQTRGWLHRFGLHVRKGLGQHFLIDEAVLETITQAAELTPADVIIEVGPGLDSQLAAILSKTLASFDNVTILNEDILRVDPAALLQEQKVRFPPGVASGYKVVANLPYYITSPVLRHFLEASLTPRIMVVMVQKEVAEAIVAEPGAMSVLSISVQFYGEPTIVGYVPAECFYPAPEVDSAVLKVRLYSRPPVAVSDREGFFRLVRAGFSAPRKQIANSLAQGLGVVRGEVLPLLDRAGIAPQRRAEALTLDQWARLWQVSTEGDKAC
jgi:16S rRNA (adenine1518-N6/adenine1519-N6)-dimethyltransferase